MVNEDGKETNIYIYVHIYYMIPMFACKCMN